MNTMNTASQPIPQGDYRPASRHENLIFTSGMTPREAGTLKFSGTVAAGAKVEDHALAVELACRNALTAARGLLADKEEISAIVSMTVYIAAELGFTSHARLADVASAFLRSELGDAGIGSRAAIGVATLPGNAPVEIQLVAAVQQVQKSSGSTDLHGSLKL